MDKAAKDDELDPVCRHRLAELRLALQGKTVLTTGGALTAEAREHDRRERLMEQFRLARQLRAIMEDAAKRAEATNDIEERRLIKQEQAHHVCTLVCLTEAVRDRYTLDDYYQYTRWVKAENEKREEEITKAKGIIRNQLRAMAVAKRNPKPNPAFKLLAPKPVLAARRKSSSTGKQKQQEEKRPQQQSPQKQQQQQQQQQQQRKSASSSSSITTTTTTNKERKPYTRAAPSAATVQQRERPTKPPPPAAAPVRRKRSASFEPGAGARSKRRNIAPRRCHDCKSTTTYYRRCQYWFLTGTRCNKTYCEKCLVGKYAESSDQWKGGVCKHIPDWHCPSCLGTCLCSECVKERKKIERRQSQVASRRSSRHTAGTNSHYPGLI